MAWTGDPVWLADVLRAEGLKVIEHPGWLNRGHGDFKDIRGVMCHHTAGGGPNDWQVVLNGRPDLPGPLAQLVLEKDGTYRVICAGVAWHAGRGSWPGWPTNNANWHVIGIEAVSRGVPDAQGRYDWTPAQLDAYRRGCAAIARKVGFGVNNIVGHKEYSSEGKIDPAGIDMHQFRRDVAQLLERPVDPDAFPLPTGRWYGPPGPPQAVSGRGPNELPEWIEGLRRWQRAQQIPVTGVYDDPTAEAAKQVQRANGWNPDGLIGPGTWKMGLRGPVTPPPPPPPPPGPPPPPPPPPAPPKGLLERLIEAVRAAIKAVFDLLRRPFDRV